MRFTRPISCASAAVTRRAVAVRIGLERRQHWFPDAGEQQFAAAPAHVEGEFRHGVGGARIQVEHRLGVQDEVPEIGLAGRCQRADPVADAADVREEQRRVDPVDEHVGPGKVVFVDLPGWFVWGFTAWLITALLRAAGADVPWDVTRTVAVAPSGAAPEASGPVP